LNINQTQLDRIEAALMFTGDPALAIEACKEIRDNIACPQLLKLAQDNVNDGLEVDEDAGTSPSEEGSWVQAWVYVKKPLRDCEACTASGDPANCDVCHGLGEVHIDFEDIA
jgi:hypothetical protein